MSIIDSIPYLPWPCMKDPLASIRRMFTTQQEMYLAMRRRALSRPILAILVVITLLSLTACDLGSGSSINNMGNEHVSGPTPVSYDIESDLKFIDLMVPHHQLAVDMARLAEENAAHGELKGMARDIIWAQEDEINRMNIWRKEIAARAPNMTPPSHSGSSDHEADPHMMGMDVDLKKLAASPNFDHDFINAMLPHHQSAIDMSRSAMPNLKKTEVRDFANDVITTQQTEIDRMLAWQKEWK